MAECLPTVPQVLQEAEDQLTSTGSHSAEFNTWPVGDDLLLVNQSTLEEVISNTCLSVGGDLAPLIPRHH